MDTHGMRRFFPAALALAAVAALVLAAVGAALEFPALVDEDVLEPSIANEVDHALAIAPTNSPPVAVTNDLFSIAGLSASDAAIRLVSTQKADGRWWSGTNDVTAAAIEILLRLR